MTTAPTKEDIADVALVDALLRSLWRTQFVTSLIAGIACVIVAISIARWLTHADIAELKQLIQGNTCHCEMNREISARATGGAVTILPDPNSFGQLTREVLQKQGNVDGDMPGTSDGTQQPVR
jgi:hypothetical protein